MWWLVFWQLPKSLDFWCFVTLCSFEWAALTSNVHSISKVCSIPLYPLAHSFSAVPWNFCRVMHAKLLIAVFWPGKWGTGSAAFTDICLAMNMQKRVVQLPTCIISWWFAHLFFTIAHPFFTYLCYLCSAPSNMSAAPFCDCYSFGFPCFSQAFCMHHDGLEVSNPASLLLNMWCRVNDDALFCHCERQIPSLRFKIHEIACFNTFPHECGSSSDRQMHQAFSTFLHRSPQQLWP